LLVEGERSCAFVDCAPTGIHLMHPRCPMAECQTLRALGCIYIEANRVSKKHNRAIIAADVRRFDHVINKDGVLGTHSYLTSRPGFTAGLFAARNSN